jgi:hypothetical protein
VGTLSAPLFTSHSRSTASRWRNHQRKIEWGNCSSKILLNKPTMIQTHRSLLRARRRPFRAKNARSPDRDHPKFLPLPRARKVGQSIRPPGNECSAVQGLELQTCTLLYY